MKPNLSEFERIVRGVLGLFAMLLGFLFIQGTAGTVLGLIGVGLVITAAVGYCGLYALLKKPAPEETKEA
jgi:hypothetical protein